MKKIKIKKKTIKIKTMFLSCAPTSQHPSINPPFKARERERANRKYKRRGGEKRR